MTEKMTCGRRLDAFGFRGNLGEDHWREGRGGLIGQESIGRSCSFCGSLDPAVFMAKLVEGWICGGTDKNYKWYLDRPYSEAEIAEHRARWETGAVGRAIARVAAEGGLDPQVELDKQWEKDWHSAGTTIAKFYTPHLSRAQCEQFLAMWSDGTLKHTMYRQPWLPALAADAPDWLVRA